MIDASIVEKTLHFKVPAGTSRGIYTTRRVWYVLFTDHNSSRVGIGECAPLPDLSCDNLADYEVKLQEFAHQTAHTRTIDLCALREYPSMLFGLETALAHLRAGALSFWNTAFAKGRLGIPINGLIWMGRHQEMLTRIELKMRQGFRCLKLKIGAIDFELELSLLHTIRKQFPADKLELRVDANGAFSPSDVKDKLQALSAYGLHSIEQPIRAGQWELMHNLCITSPIPIALDEELIGVNQPEIKQTLLQSIRPQYIILKPSLHGGFSGCCEWMRYADALNVQYWATSALESNIGLNAIAQWAAAVMPEAVVQGLGTGQLFTDNIPCGLSLQGDLLYFDPASDLPIAQLFT